MIELAEGGVIAGKYRLDYQIGRGGMGSVWAAYHIQLETRVALKFIDPGTDGGDARARFEREARAAAQLRSPHVVQILDHGVDVDRPYIAMELLEGEDMGERLRREKRLSLKATAVILTQAAKALRRAHDAGVIHRDLKPSNIFLARFDDDEVVKLLDFGVAKIRNPGIDAGSEFTQTGVIFGSPAYMSPEQARGAKLIDHRSDLWSLAVIVFRALTGEKPFEASSIGDLVIKLCIDPLPVASKFAPDLSPEIDAFFLKSFARDPDQRFPSAVAMAAEIEAIAAREAAPSSGAVADPLNTLMTTVVMKPRPSPPYPPPPSSSGMGSPGAGFGSMGSPGAGPPSSGSGVFAQAPDAVPDSFTNPALIAPLSTALPQATGQFPAPPPLPSMTPSPPSRTPSGSMRVVVPSAPASDQKRLILWGAIGGSVFASLVLIIGVSQYHSGSDGPGADPAGTTTAAAQPAPSATTALPPEPSASAAPPPPATIEPQAPPTSSATPDTTSLPEAQGTTAPTAEATAPSTSAAPSAHPPRGPGGKGGKGHVPNFGY